MPVKRRILMAVAAVAGVFAAENAIDILVSRYADVAPELVVWFALAVLCAWVVYEVGEDRGDW